MKIWIAISGYALALSLVGWLDIVYLPFVFILAAYNILNKKMMIDDLSIIVRVGIALTLVLASLVVTVYAVMKS